MWQLQPICCPVTGEARPSQRGLGKGLREGPGRVYLERESGTGAQSLGSILYPLTPQAIGCADGLVGLPIKVPPLRRTGQLVPCREPWGDRL